MVLTCPRCRDFVTDTRHGLKIHLAKVHDLHGEELAREVNKAMKKRGVNCAVCGDKIIPVTHRTDNRKITHGKHEGKYLCCNCSIYDLEDK